MDRLEQKVEESMLQIIGQQQIYAYLFVNSSSGSCVGHELINPINKENKITTKNNKTFYFYIFDLYSQTQRVQGFQRAKQKNENGKNVIIISCGGDGTVQWVLQQTIKSNINLDTITYSVLPIGTGNDFAKSVGWGSFQFNKRGQKFQLLAEELQKCSIGFFDVWQIVVQCYDQGSITQIKNGIQVERSSNKIVKNFTNYFGIGTDAQICYVAQKLNAKTILFKKIAYGFAGILSYFIFWGGLKRKIVQLKQFMDEKPDPLKQSISDQQQTNKQVSTNKNQSQKLIQKIQLSKFDSCLTFLNTTSSMDLQNVWQTPYLNAKDNMKEFTKQRVNDGLIQIVSYTNQISLWFQRIFHMAKKVSQGNGPFMINFKKSNSNNYIHINGQPYKIKSARSITISPSSQFPGGKIRVLYRNQK